MLRVLAEAPAKRERRIVRAMRAMERRMGAECAIFERGSKALLVSFREVVKGVYIEEVDGYVDDLSVHLWESGSICMG